MGDITKEEVRERLGNIDQIRDIIFGAQTRDYDNRFYKIESDLAMLQQETRDRLDQLKVAVTADLRAAVEVLDKKLKSFNLSSQEECADLRQQIDRLTRKFSSNIQTLDEALDTQSTSLHTELADTRDGLQQDIAALRDLVLEEMERCFSQLRDNKVSKDDMAEMLFHLGMRLKGSEFIPALKEKADSVKKYEDIPLYAVRKHSEEAVPS
jgi:prefoldin subunit 5